jgi:hypothetical protein
VGGGKKEGVHADLRRKGRRLAQILDWGMFGRVMPGGVEGLDSADFYAYRFCSSDMRQVQADWILQMETDEV